MIKNKSKDWKNFHLKSIKYNKFPKYPQELMLRTLFGRYSGLNLLFKKNSKIIDVGCGFGNNLIPFLNLGSKVYGVEIDKVICNITMKILKKNFPNKDIHIKVGHNRSIPFKSNFFDLVMTNTLHYESSLYDVNKALSEYSRVIKKNKFVYITTTGNKSDFYKKTKKISKNIYKISDKKDKIRFGKNFFFFENENFFKKVLSKHFTKVILGRDTDVINGNCTDVFMAICQK